MEYFKLCMCPFKIVFLRRSAIPRQRSIHKYGVLSDAMFTKYSMGFYLQWFAYQATSISMQHVMINIEGFIKRASKTTCHLVIVFMSATASMLRTIKCGSKIQGFIFFINQVLFQQLAYRIQDIFKGFIILCVGFLNLPHEHGLIKAIKGFFNNLSHAQGPLWSRYIKTSHVGFPDPLPRTHDIIIA